MAESTYNQIQPQTAVEISCNICSLTFPSKRQLFKHLEEHGFDNPNSKPHKAIILFGWMSDVVKETNDCWLKETEVISDPQNERNEYELFRAIDIVNNNMNGDLENIHVVDTPEYQQKLIQEIIPKLAYSRSSSCSQKSNNIVGMEPSNHGLCDTLCIQSKRRVVDTEAWIAAVNKILPPHLRVFDYLTLPSSAYGFHAEMNCTQRRYEFLLPINVVMPPECQVVPESPIVRKWQKRAAILEAVSSSSSSSAISSATAHEAAPCNDDSCNDNSGGVRYSIIEDVEVNDEVEDYKQILSAMDVEFPAETVEGQIRIAYFRQLKVLLKQFQGRFSMHNCCALGGGCPEESPCQRRLDRFYHKEIVTLNNQCWALFSISGDVFLKGQVARLAGLALGVARGWLPDHYFTAALLDRTGLIEVPTIPGHLIYLAESRYAFYEASIDPKERLDPRRVTSAGTAAVAAVAKSKSMDVEEDSSNNSNSKGIMVEEVDAAVTVESFVVMNGINLNVTSAISNNNSSCDDEVDTSKSSTGSHINLENNVETPSGYEHNSSDKNGSYNKSKCSSRREEKRNKTNNKDSSNNKTNTDSKNNSATKSPSVSNTTTNNSNSNNSNNDVGLNRKRNIVNGIKRISDWRRVIHQKVADQYQYNQQQQKQQYCNNNCDSIDERSTSCDHTTTTDNTTDNNNSIHSNDDNNNNNNWLKIFKQQCIDMCTRYETLLTLRQRPATALQQSLLTLTNTPLPSPSAMPAVYGRVLQLLRQADHSGNWPLSSTMRSKIITADTLLTEADIVNGPTNTTTGCGGKRGGSFSVGRLPVHLPQPKGNTLFPELMEACFELERLLCPHRYPGSSTIAINRHAQFLPHRDSGAGSGQSTSLIVALGDYTGGELVLDTTAIDIRYKPLEFDGWSTRHWTLPFEGERYSLVWFTPLGLELTPLEPSVTAPVTMTTSPIINTTSDTKIDGVSL